MNTNRRSRRTLLCGEISTETNSDEIRESSMVSRDTQSINIPFKYSNSDENEVAILLKLIVRVRRYAKLSNALSPQTLERVVFVLSPESQLGLAEPLPLMKLHNKG